MAMDGLVLDLVKFFKTAQHLWGRCPSCREPFRLSDAAVSSSPQPPKDWLRALDREREALETKELRLEELAELLDSRQEEFYELERELREKEKNLAKSAKQIAGEMLKNDAVLNARIRDARRAAIMRSRSVLLGKLLECIAPCFRQFGHDPRDMRSICDPVDYVVFDGLTVDRAVQEVIFVEVKSGTSRLSSAQRSIREAVQKRRVRWEQWTIGDPKIPINRQLVAPNRKQLPAAIGN